ncbi:FAP9, ras superfamily GTPase-like flagellar protein [Tribonema minus]|uniref:FAP9, ras superfamily GTPase-like flagellar protein n=1 Tax=Tribonema minus TaxID=303371 RepID=A0A836CPS0_9STRA|nr:FAP9, ras superfamily GTPase-like flagellar protein [Tribonema minus]
MAPSSAAKIVVCGPSRGGKTSLANFLAGLSESVGHPSLKYEPTAGVRILECERQPGIAGGKVMVELWDVSGNMSYETCWPAIIKDADGVVLVFNPEIPTHEPEIATWYDQFALGPKVPIECCLVVAHRADPKPVPRPRVPPKLANVAAVSTSFASAQAAAAAFDDLLRAVQSSKSARK